MNEETTFLTAMRAAASDLTTRAVYADWLDERDDARANFVRLLISFVEVESRIREQAPNFDAQWVRIVDPSRFAAARSVSRIEAIRAPSKFVPEAHLAIAVDGVPLDVSLGVDGLVSSLLGWFHSDEDSAVPWQRILPDVGTTAYAPLLICPDDLDLCCSVVMAEVASEPEFICWNRLGYNASPRNAFGACIQWEPNWGPYRFRRVEYEACLAAFRPAET